MAAKQKYPTPKELEFVAKYLGNGLQAAAEIGITGDTPKKAEQNQKAFVNAALKKPSVRKLIDIKFRRFAAAAGLKQGHQLSKTDLVDEILALARVPISETGDRMNGQVSAYELAAKILEFITNRVEINDITRRLQGKSPDELLFINHHRRDPVNREELERFMHEHKEKQTVQ